MAFEADETLPWHVLAEVRLALDTAGLLYPGHGRVTIGAAVLGELLERALECDTIEAERDASHEATVDAKAKRIRAVLANSKESSRDVVGFKDQCPTCGAPTDAGTYDNPVEPLCEAIDSLLDDL